jgi:hypothetical protein
MADACPVSFDQINERVARVNSALPVLSMIVFLFTPFKTIGFVFCFGRSLFEYFAIPLAGRVYPYMPDFVK